MFLLCALLYISLEIYLFYILAVCFGPWAIPAMLAASGLAGLALLRRGGAGTAGAMIFNFLSGLFLVVPGVLSTLVGFLLLMPPVRRFLARRTGEYALEKTGLGRVIRWAGRGEDLSAKFQAGSGGTEKGPAREESREGFEDASEGVAARYKSARESDSVIDAEPVKKQ
ncbi:MAG: FxsA family protein [Deltaproteobacteria bacterium]|jgi:UPF0716 protein FxsA|nr:FxsA family protein [Deltaproteobacteria bacterium]